MKKLFGGHMGRAFFITISDAAQKGSTALLSLVLARFLGPSEFGVFAAVTAASGVIILVTNIGLELEIVRRSTRETLAPILSLAQLLVTFSVLAAMVVFAVYELFFLAPVIPAGLLALAFFVDVANRYHIAYRSAGIVLGEPQAGAIIHSVATAALIALTIGVMFVSRSVPAVLTVQLAVALAVLLAWETWRRRRGLGHALPPDTVREAKSFFRGAASFALTNTLWALYFNIGVVMMTSLRPTEDVGVFSAVYRIVAMTFILSYAVTSSFSPSLFEAARNNRGGHAPLAWEMMRRLALVGGGVSLGLLLFSPVVIRVVMGEAFESGALTARILAGAAFLRAFNFGFCEILTTGGRHRWRVGLEALLLVTYVGLNALLIPDFGPTGAAVAAVSAEAIMSTVGAVLWWRLRRIAG